MNTPLETIRIFRGTADEVAAAETIDKSMYLATDTQEIFFGNADGTKTQYSGGTFKTNDEVMSLIKGYNADTVSEFRVQITDLSSKLATKLAISDAKGLYAPLDGFSALKEEVAAISSQLFSGSAKNMVPEASLSRSAASKYGNLLITLRLSESSDSSGRVSDLTVIAPASVALSGSEKAHCPMAFVDSDSPSRIECLDAIVFWNGGLFVDVWGQDASGSPVRKDAWIKGVEGIR
jgi:hypothetical protein